MNKWILDTGPLVAYLDAADLAHVRVADTLDDFKGDLYTTSAVIVEAMHFVGVAAEGPALLVEFIEASGTMVSECTGPEQLRRAIALMRKYADTPMDFADATLVLLAESLKCTRICTLDHRGFRTYRTFTGKPFSLVLDSL